MDVDKVMEVYNDCIASGKFDEAVALLDKVLKSDPENAQYLYMKGCALGEKGDFQAAIEAYEESAVHAGDMAATPLYNLGNLYKDDLQDVPKALETYTRVLDVDPTMADALINMGCMLDDAGQHQLALECYDNALMIDEMDPMTWANRGNSLRSLKNFDEAEKSYRQALAIENNYFAAQVGLGACLAMRGDARSIELLEKVYESTGSPDVLFELGMALAKFEKYEDALECYDMLAKYGMAEAALWNNRGECLAKLKNIEEALSSFDRAIGIDAEFEAAYFGKARVLVNADRIEEACLLLQQLQQFASEEYLNEPSVQALLSVAVVK